MKTRPIRIRPAPVADYTNGLFLFVGLAFAVGLAFFAATV